MKKVNSSTMVSKPVVCLNDEPAENDKAAQIRIGFG